MAENEDEEVLEAEKVNDEEGSESEGESKGGSFLSKITSKLKLSTSMMIYIAGGLAVLIIALAAFLFFTSGDEEAEAESELVEQELQNDSNTVADEASATLFDEETPTSKKLSAISLGMSEPEPEGEPVEEEGLTIPDLAPMPEPTMANPEEEMIELPPIPDMPDVSGAVVAIPEVMGPMASEAEQALPLSEEDKKLELFKLREQALLLEEENRRLKQRLSKAEEQNYSGESKPTPSKPREREPELPKPTWGDFAPVYRGP